MSKKKEMKSNNTSKSNKMNNSFNDVEESKDATTMESTSTKDCRNSCSNNHNCH